MQPCEGRKAAVSARDHVLSPDPGSKALDALRHQFGMLDKIRGRVEHSWDQHFTLVEFDFLKDLPFVLMPRIGRFN